MLIFIRIFFVGFLIFAGSFAGAQEELSWEDCLHEAAKNHPDLIAAQEEVVQEQAAKTITRSSALPQITSDLNVAASNSTSSGASNAFSYGVSGSQLLFDGFKTVNNVKAA